MHRLSLLVTLAGCVLLVGPSTGAYGRIKLITLPVRERVEVQLDHPNITLVEEERIVPLVKGVNQVDFSWANTRIDPNTIVFRVIGPGGDRNEDAPEINVLSVSYPPNENALVWQVASSKPGSARVRISYVLGNLTKSFNYRAVAANDEATLVLSQYMRLQNLANEEFGSSDIWAGFGPRFHKPIGINETKEMLVEKFRQVPITKTYTCNPAEFDYLDRPKNKLRVPMHYVIKNDKANGLGAAPLPFGKVRIFQDDGRGTTAFLGEDWGKFTPIDDEMKLYLGVAQDIVVKRTIEKNERHRVAGNLYDYEIIIKYEIENFKNKPVILDVAEDLRYVRNEVRRDTGRDVEWELGKQTTLGDPDKEDTTQQRVVFHVNLPAASRGKNGKAQKIVHKLHVIIRNEW
ncbi:MAG: hypothetical protein V3U29_04850 [Phycisphaeraceae bacterium]